MRTIPIIAGLAMLAGCSGSGSDDHQATAAQSTPAVTRQKTVVDDQLKALEKARGVEQQLQQEKERRDHELDEAGG